MMSFLIDFFVNNYHTFTVLICMLVITLFDKSIEKSERIKMIWIIAFLFVIFTNEYIELILQPYSMAEFWRLRFLLSSIKYSMEPVIAFIFCVFMCRFSKKKAVLFSIPLFANAYIFIESLWTGRAFRITPENHYNGTALTYLPMAVGVFYLIVVIVHLIVYRKEYNRYQIFGILFIIASSIIGMILQNLYDGIYISYSILIGFIMYYLVSYIGRSDEIIKYQKEKLTAQKNALLVSQIHPHFIFNTLNSIYFLSRTDKEKTSAAIMDFSDYLHDTLDVSLNNELLPFSREIEITKRYTKLEQLRFENLKIEFDISDDDFMIPALSVQPLVENAIRHGVRGRKDGLIIVSSRRIKLDNNYYYRIIIEDNGTGFDINKPKESRYSGKHAGIGLSNVCDRIKNMVGGTADIYSEIGKGTLITITIPEKQEQS